MHQPKFDDLHNITVTVTRVDTMNKFCSTLRRTIAVTRESGIELWDTIRGPNGPLQLPNTPMLADDAQTIESVNVSTIEKS